MHTEGIYVFRMIPNVNKNFLLIQPHPTGFCSGDIMSFL
jgi:hypothetical protein